MFVNVQFLKFTDINNRTDSKFIVIVLPFYFNSVNKPKR